MNILYIGPNMAIYFLNKIDQKFACVLLCFTWHINKIVYKWPYGSSSDWAYGIMN